MAAQTALEIGNVRRFLKGRVRDAPAGFALAAGRHHITNFDASSARSAAHAAEDKVLYVGTAAIGCLALSEAEGSSAARLLCVVRPRSTELRFALQFRELQIARMIGNSFL